MAPVKNSKEEAPLDEVPVEGESVVELPASEVVPPTLPDGPSAAGEVASAAPADAPPPAAGASATVSVVADGTSAAVADDTDTIPIMAKKKTSATTMI